METAAPVYREEVEEGLLNGRESQVGQETAARGEKEGRPGIREERASSSSHRHYLSNRTAFSITTYCRVELPWESFTLNSSRTKDISFDENVDL